MFGFSKKAEKKPKFDRKILRKNDISLLILDERWNGLFENKEKTPEIIRCEEKIRELLKDEVRLNSQLKEISPRKRHFMDKIMKLTTEAFDKNNDDAKSEMRQCEKEIKKLNEKALEIENELDTLPGLLKEANLELLEHTVTLVYFKMREDQKRSRELDQLIEDTKSKLEEYILERDSLSQNDTATYSYFHDLIGGEELEKLDKEYFGEEFTYNTTHKKNEDTEI
ncbi:MAG: hypothetical protein N2645_19330 [Clostridia bacterium]|nr:hypothetical protein [Clostridia bacterium]